MGKRAVGPTNVSHNVTPIARPIRKRRSNGLNISAVAAAKTLRLSAAANNDWHENDDEDSSSNDIPPARNQSNKHANNSSILLNTSFVSENPSNESPKPVYTLRPSLVNGTILYDLMHKEWRLGRPIGKGNFGEIFLATNKTNVAVTNENANFVVKIEPHSNGPLFVEIHCLMNTAKKDSLENPKTENEDDKKYIMNIPRNPPSGIPEYIASGSHFFGNARYRFLVLQRYDRDLHSLIKNCRVHQKFVLTLAIHILNVLENLHDKGYCHNDIKAQNLMISKCKYYKKQKLAASGNVINGNGHSKVKIQAGNGSGGVGYKTKYEDHDEKQQTTDSGNSSEQEHDDDYDKDFCIKRSSYDDDLEDDEDFDDGATTNSNNSNSMDVYETPIIKERKGRRGKNIVEFSGSNPVRSCRRQKRNSIYDEMVKSHYLRPSKRVSYMEFFNEDGQSVASGPHNNNSVSSDDESEEFVPGRRTTSVRKSTPKTRKRLTRPKVKMLTSTVNNNSSHHNNQQQHHHNNHHHHHQQQQQQQQQQHNNGIQELIPVEEERIFLIDYGLASKLMDNNGVHRPFVMDQRRAHDGTLEFTSRDAHMGAHSRRSDLECLGYNLIFWSQGYLPWKDAAQQHQQEQVHRAKEYLMTDVREILKQIYGKQMLKSLGEFLFHVGKLAYSERPDYERYRRIFQREYQQLGYSLSGLQLNSQGIKRTCVSVKEEIENKNDIFEMNKNCNSWSMMKNTSFGTPFHERTNRISPKNLRSKSDQKSIKKKKFCWAEVLSQDPDQIARERAEKEFDREEELSDAQQTVVRRYKGKPTYAIIKIQERLRESGRLIDREEDEEHVEEDDNEQEAEQDEDEEENEVDDNNEDEQEEDGEDSSEYEVSEDEEEVEEEEVIESDIEEDEEEVEEMDVDNDSEEDDDNEAEYFNEDSNAETETDATEASAAVQYNGTRRRRKKAITLIDDSNDATDATEALKDVQCNGRSRRRIKKPAVSIEESNDATDGTVASKDVQCNGRRCRRIKKHANLMEESTDATDNTEASNENQCNGRARRRRSKKVVVLREESNDASDATETSKEVQCNGRKRRGRPPTIVTNEETNDVTDATDSTDASKDLQCNGRGGNSRKNKNNPTNATTKKLTSLKEEKTRSNLNNKISSIRKRSSKKSITGAALAQAISKTSGCVTRKGRKGRPSLKAAAVVENQEQLFNKNKSSIGNDTQAVKAIDRRTRRCLLKTEACFIIEDSNSNLSQDMRGIYNKWKHTSNENVYLKGSKAAAAKNYRK